MTRMHEVDFEVFGSEVPGDRQVDHTRPRADPGAEIEPAPASFQYERG